MTENDRDLNDRLLMGLRRAAILIFSSLAGVS